MNRFRHLQQLNEVIFMSKLGVARISISLPPNLLEEFDNVIQQIGYDRSKAIQNMTNKLQL
ncbi:MAG: CopG family ribbon-helix-helix protein [Candidatus Hermodarchaeia archaeon]